MSWVCLGFVTVAAAADLCTGRVPNLLILAGLGTGWLFRIAAGSAAGIGDGLAGMCLPLLLGWILFRIRAFGAGDIKLLSFIGCFQGSRAVLSCMLISILLAGIYSLARLLRRRQLVPAFTDFFLYLEDISKKKQLLPYTSGRRAGRVVHFAVFIWLGCGIRMILTFFPDCGIPVILTMV